MLSKKSLFLCSPNSVSHHDPSLCLIKMNWSFIFLFLHISSHLHFPPMNLKKRFSDRFPTEMGSDIPRHNGGGQMSHGGLHSLCDAFWLAENWKCFHSIGSALKGLCYLLSYQWNNCTHAKLRLVLNIKKWQGTAVFDAMLPLSELFPSQCLGISME